jgi:hypothetical protein
MIDYQATPGIRTRCKAAKASTFAPGWKQNMPRCSIFWAGNGITSRSTLRAGYRTLSSPGESRSTSKSNRYGTSMRPDRSNTKC